MRTEFFHLKKLCVSNDIKWSFTADDTPFSDEAPHSPAHLPDDIVKLIAAQEQYSKAEAFYLAASTTWGLRREDMARIKKRDYDDNKILIKTSHRSLRVTHLMPDNLRAIFQAYHPSVEDRSALTKMYHRILAKAGVERKTGMGFHSVRRTLRTVLEWELAKARLPLSLVAEYQGWAKTTKGMVYGGAPMLGVYAHHEVMSSDPFWVDRLIYPIHPWLKLWAPAPVEKKEEEECLQQLI